MDPDPEFIILPAYCTDMPIAAIRISSRKKIAQFMDLEGRFVELEDETEYINNYVGLAEMARFDQQTLKVLEKQQSPTVAFLDQWNGINATVGNLWQFLFLLERADVLKACRKNILSDCKIFKEQKEIEECANRHFIEQDQNVTSTVPSEMMVNECAFSSKGDVEQYLESKSDSRIPEEEQVMYDAFVCYSDSELEDRNFVRKIIYKLEKERGLKLFVPGRDDLPGEGKHQVNAYRIEKRCLRTIVLMSKSFFKSEACDFQVKFAFALAPGARSKKLIPIIKEKGITVPRILKFLAMCDFTKPDMDEWTWDRLYTALKAPLGKVTYFTEEDDDNPFKDITDLKQIEFKMPTHRLDEDMTEEGPSAGVENWSENPVVPMESSTDTSSNTAKKTLYERFKNPFKSKDKKNDLNRQNKRKGGPNENCDTGMQSGASTVSTNSTRSKGPSSHHPTPTEHSYHSKV